MNNSIAEKVDHGYSKPVSKPNSYTYPVINNKDVLKKWIWIYFILLIIEGALRKWIFPSLSAPLLIIRDPVAMVILYMAWKRKLLAANYFTVTASVIAVVSVITAVYFGHGNFVVAIYGARILLLHFPLIFVIGSTFNYQDVLKIGKLCVYITLPMTVLIALQFYSPQSAWVNRGLGGDLQGGGFSGALGYFRPPGTFSFTTGVTQFYGFTATFMVFFWFTKYRLKKILLIASTLCLLMAIPLSISRSLFFSVMVTFLFGAIALMKKPLLIFQSFIALVLIGYLVYFLSGTAAFQGITHVFMTRFDSASKTEGGLKGTLIDRYLGGMIGALNSSVNEPFFGHGLGMGTNVGGMLLTGKQDFLISEGEWGRLIGELGLFLGLIVILLRVLLSAQLALKAYKEIRNSNVLPWILASFALLMIPQGQWAQPTTLGFSVMAGGLVLAALNREAS